MSNLDRYSLLDADDRVRFWNNVRQHPMGCWRWILAHKGYGYGIFGAKGKKYRAHCLCYFFATGTSPSGRVVMHRCDNPWCVNPDHLCLGTQAENMKDAATKGRMCKGQARKSISQVGKDRYNAKIDDETVREVRSLAGTGMSFEAIGNLFGISPSSAHRVARRKSWAHVK